MLLAKNTKLDLKCALRMVEKCMISGGNRSKVVDGNFTRLYIPKIVNKCPFFVHLLDIFQTEVRSSKYCFVFLECFYRRVVVFFFSKF